MRTTADIMDNANLQTVLKQWHNIYDIQHIFLWPADNYVFSSISCFMYQPATTLSELCKSKLDQNVYKLQSQQILDYSLS